MIYQNNVVFLLEILKCIAKVKIITSKFINSETMQKWTVQKKKSILSVHIRTDNI